VVTRLMAMGVALALGVAAAACDGVGKGSSDPDDLFRTQVIPILEQDCATAACHAAVGDVFDTLDPGFFAFPVDDDGRITGEDRVRKAYERSVEKLSAGGPMFAPFIRKPLDESLGGTVHRGAGSQYRSMNDERLKVLLAWAAEAAPAEEPVLSPLQQRYRDDIQIVLAEKRCMLSSCHGDSASNRLEFDPGVQGEFDAQITIHNYESVIRTMNLETPDPSQSRLVRKTIPQAQGGIFHRGGNAFFEHGDEELQRILDFVADARRELGDEHTGITAGIVFVATDPTPRNLFDIAAWQPGGDVYSLVPATPGGTLTNLTEGHRSGPADIRDPAVSYGADRIAFSMRRSLADCLNLYVMNLDGTNLRQLTFDSGCDEADVPTSNVEPLWGPDDRIYFMSTRGGQLSAHAPVPRSNLWRIDSDGDNLLRISFWPGSELAPNWRFFKDVGRDRPEVRTLEVTFTATRAAAGRMFGALMRRTPDLRSDYHPQYGTQNPTYQIFTQISQLPDHREIVLLMDEANVWEGGAVAIFDRNLGPMINDGGKPAVVNYVDGLQQLGTVGEEVSHRGFSVGGYYRDPIAEPEGTILVSHSPAAIDLSDPSASPDTALYRLTFTDLPGNRVIVTRKELLVDVPGKIETDPRPIYVRRREEIGNPLDFVVTNDRDTAELLSFDFPVAMGLLREISPSGTKDFDQMATQASYVRLVEELPRTPAHYPLWPDTSVSLIGRGKHGLRRVLAEVPLAADKSYYVELPAAVPFFIQALDHSRAATFTTNQWFFLLPGEKFNQMLPRNLYNVACGACHGARGGVPAETVVAPDVITEASVVLANYDPATRTELPPTPHGLRPEERLEVDFERDVQPILDSGCATAGCHVAGGVAPDLSARPGVAGFSGSYEALTAPGTASGNGFLYVDPDSSRSHTSYLTEVLIGRDLDAPRPYDSTGCPGAGGLSLAQVSTLLRWMDLGAAYRGIGPKDPAELPHYPENP
jgi:hypothetical protein